MMAEMVFQALEQAGRNFLQALADLLPRTILTISIVLVGWIIASILRWVTRTLLTRLGFGRLCARQGLTDMLRAADLPDPERLVAAIVFWIVWIGFLLSAVDVLGLTVVRGIIDDFAEFVPRLLVAIAILVVGFVFANVAWRATQLAAVNARVPSPRVLSGTVRALVLLLTGAMALDQIAVARTIVLTAFAIAFGAVMFGLAIAFGVGGGGIARRILEHWFPEKEETRPDDLRHL
jgi:hypothetical protein